MTGGFGSLPLAESYVANEGVGESRVLGPKWARMPILTVGLLGVQILWSVEMSYASPYLLSLGLAKSNMAIVFLAGPISGFLIHPLIGVLADNSTSRWGRRRPFIMAGCVLSVAGLLLLGYTREFSSLFTGYENHANDIVTIWLAILSIYLIDFSINAVQAADRALLVDTLAPSLQPSGNAWAALMLGVGSVVGFYVGNLDLPSLLPFLGSSELQVLAVLVSTLILTGHIITATFVKEKVFVRASGLQKPSFRTEIRQILSSILTLPWVIRQICIIQFFAWLGWFPVLFYTTMYISDLHSKTAHGSASPEEVSAEGTRLGSRALFYSAVLALLTNLILPLFISASDTGPHHARTAQANAGKIATILFRWFKIHLSTLWAFSHLLFSACMLGTFFASTVEGATVLICLTGFSWAIAQWAPFALLAEAILTSPPPKSATIPSREEEDLLLASHPNRAASSISHRAQEGVAGNLSAKAGIILGIHNIFVVIPQFLVTILCAIVFARFDTAVVDGTLDGKEIVIDFPDDRPNPVVYIFRLGAVWSLIAFVICRRLGKELRRLDL
ncbi:major facilitator superfamily domain-containing protein [Mycena rebaudengoi]|nr:major facilitator superfamily domain-containing protein [Mycena rebaudengoi]